MMYKGDGKHIGSCLASSTCNASDLFVNGSSCRAWSYSICMGTDEALSWDTFDTMMVSYEYRFVFLGVLRDRQQRHSKL